MNVLYYGDNLDVLRRHVQDETVDLIYLDPPFNSNADYNLLFTEHGEASAAQVQAFTDTWEWNVDARAAYEQTVESGGPVAETMRAFRTMLGPVDMLAYLSMMAPRLVELRRVLKSTGSIYLHCDPTASHYLKLLMDAVFGARAFQNEVIWHYRGGGVSKERWGRRHDVLLFYAKGASHTFNVDEVREPYSQDSLDRLKYKAKSFRGDRVYDGYEPNPLGKHPDDVWDMQPIMPSAKERLGYPTQKPLALLDRILKASSDPGDLVLDPFCGCGTTVDAAQALGRRWIGIDITHLSIGLIKHRLVDRYGQAITSEYRVVGEPTTIEDAEVLAREDPFQFQAWALGLVGARVAGSDKRGGDKGIDGRLYFHIPTDTKTRQIVFSVKAGKLVPAYLRDLRGVVQREDAEIGVLVSFEEPSSGMRAEAAEAGFYESPWGRHPRLQMRTVGQLLHGQGIDYPHVTGANVTHRRAAPARPGPPEPIGLFEHDVNGPENSDHLD
jgi:DNA modification methylase